MQLLLEKNEIFEAGNQRRETRIICHAGQCWITISGDSRDYVLHSGKSMTIYGRGAVCISALNDTRVQFVIEKKLTSWLHKLTGRRTLTLKKKALLQ